MIKVNDTTVELRGNIIQLFSEATTMLRSLHEAASEIFDPDMADCLIADLFEIAKIDESDIEKCDILEIAETLAKKAIDGKEDKHVEGARLGRR